MAAYIKAEPGMKHSVIYTRRQRDWAAGRRIINKITRGRYDLLLQFVRVINYTVVVIAFQPNQKG